MKYYSTGILMLLLMMTVGLTSCEKAVFDEDTKVVNPENANLIIRVTGNRINDTFETRAMVDITTYCTRFNFVLYKDGEKVESRSQLKGDADYGQVSLSLATGTYKLLVLAHSSSGGNPSLSDPENIQFTNALGYNDTFYYYGDIEVTKESKTHEIKLTRVATKLTFVINDEIPSDVKYVNIYYTGGSGVFNAVTGYGGNVNSQQQKLVKVEGQTSPLRIPVYTFLREDTGILQLKVTAYSQYKSSSDNTVYLERSFSDIPVERQKETICEGDFFEHNSVNAFSFVAETDWELLQHISY